MALRQIFGAAHFLEPADGALELEAEVAGWIKAFGLRIGGGEQLYLMLIKRINQSDEARGLVALVGSHHRDADDDHRVIPTGDRKIVGRSARFAAQPLEREDRDALQAFWNVQRSLFPNFNLRRRDLGPVFDRVIGELEEGAERAAVASGPLGTCQTSTPVSRSRR